jgi:hypothetical protein
MAVTRLQSRTLCLVPTKVSAMVRARDGKTAAYPRAFLSLPSRLPIWRTRPAMPNRMAGRQRFDIEHPDVEAASAARTGRSAGSAGGLPQGRPHACAGFGTWTMRSAKRSSKLARPNTWPRRFGA